MFERDSREVARARHVVRALMSGWGLEEDVPAFELAASELVSNALVHGSGQVELHLSCEGDRLRLEVGDEGTSPESAPEIRSRRIGGWGLRFVERLSESWGAERHERGTRVWMVKAVSMAG